MIKKLLLASAATALLTGAPSAADLPRGAPPPPVFPPVPVFTWTRASFGINAGYAVDASSRSDNSTFRVHGGVGLTNAPAAVHTFPKSSPEG
ncbi:porin family protein, partial [Methylobacterium sp. E-066]|nr:porin family protein [Methylobacterium sp. E-066]